MTKGLGWLAVDASGLVECPRRHEAVELQRCLECSWLLDLDRAAGAPALRCASVDPVPVAGRSNAGHRRSADRE